MSKFLLNFPGEPRDTQVSALQKIETAISKNKKFIIVCAPTGSGKSHIGASIALSSKKCPNKFIEMIDDLSLYEKDDYSRYVYEEDVMAMGNHRATVCTVTKALQDQYNNLFESHSVVFKGKTNYMCQVDNNFDCETAPCVADPYLKKKCQVDKVCDYYNARDNSLGHNFSVMNYSAFLCLPQHTKQVEYLICDEASELEDEICSYYTVTINYMRLASALGKSKIKKLKTENLNDGYTWLRDLGEELKFEYDKFAHRLTKIKNNKRKLAVEISNFKTVKSLYDNIIVLLSNWYKTEIVIECKSDDVTFTPLYVNNLAASFFDCAKHVILMSATIIDAPNFARRLGINDYEYIEVANTFDSKKSPIYCKVAKYNLNYNNIDNNLPKVITQIEKICNHYNDKKGIIHTHSFKITELIQKKLKNNKRFLYREPGVNNEKLIELHENNSKPTVVVSPSLTFGTDLKDDLGRFQIIVKLPYPSLASKKIKTLFERDKAWYANKMLNALVQACGRCTRHKDDYSDTFILDGQILQVLKMNWTKLPDHFKTRIH